MIFIETQSKEHVHHLFLKLDGKPIGSAEFHHVQDECQIIDIQIQEAFRRKGYGQKLLEEIIQQSQKRECQKWVLEVRSQNLGAIRLYQKNGFIQNGLRKKYYPDDDAVLMIRESKEK